MNHSEGRKRIRVRWISHALAGVSVMAFAVAGCGPADNTPGGSGGSPGSGGKASSTGGSSSGGASGSGGAPGSGGALATGGMTGSGGSPGSGGAPVGGAGGGGGRAATGGAAGGGGVGSGGRGGAGSGGRGGAAGGAATGGAGGAAGSGNGGAGAFSPCPATGACKIMPLGDSITEGAGSSGGGYRPELFRLSITATKNITFVGRQANGPTSVMVNGMTHTFPRNHEGYSGYTIEPGGGRQGISQAVPTAAIAAANPHIILLMIGTNDVNLSLELTQAPTKLGALIDRLVTDAPNALVVVARLVPTTNDGINGRVRTYNDAIPGLVKTRADAGKHVVTVDMYAAFTANTNYKTALMNDELHPNDAGYAVMAQTWMNAIRDHLK